VGYTLLEPSHRTSTCDVAEDVKSEDESVILYTVLYTEILDLWKRIPATFLRKQKDSNYELEPIGQKIQLS
jgi:hypothetical protein